MSDFIRQQIEKRLKELRDDCGLQRLHLRNAHGPRWSGCQRRNPEKPDGWELYWENLQAAAQAERPTWVKAADQALSDFIAEHRPIMGAGWIGNDHGRLCWSAFLGGSPIDQHYCQREEGHSGPHGNKVGEWPIGVTNCHEWNRLLEKLPKGSTGLEQSGGGTVPAHADESRPQTAPAFMEVM